MLKKRSYPIGIMGNLRKDTHILHHYIVECCLTTIVNAFSRSRSGILFGNSIQIIIGGICSHLDNDFVRETDETFSVVPDG